MIFCNFGRICRISLYKGSLGDWEFWGFLLWQAAKPSPDKRPFSILHSAMNCIQRTPDTGASAVYDSVSGAKVIILFESAKSIHHFFFWVCQSLYYSPITMACRSVTINKSQRFEFVNVLLYCRHRNIYFLGYVASCDIVISIYQFKYGCGCLR